MIRYAAKKIRHVTRLTTAVLISVLLLAACQPHIYVSVDEKPIPAAKPTEKTEEYHYRDSTLFFDDDHASLSMRATLKKEVNTLAKGYKFQFRSRRDLPVKISNIAITAAGKRIVLEAGTLSLPRDKSLIFELSTTDSQFIQGQSQVTFLFNYENITKAALIEQYQLVEFISESTD